MTDETKQVLTEIIDRLQYSIDDLRNGQKYHMPDIVHNSNFVIMGMEVAIGIIEDKLDIKEQL